MDLKKRGISAEYNKLLHHLYIEFPELAEITSKTLRSFDISKRKKLSAVEFFRKEFDKLKIEQETCEFHKMSPIEELRFFFCNAAKKCPSTHMSRFQLRNIKISVQLPGLMERYAEKVEEMFAEIRDDYLKVTHASGIRGKIRGDTEIPGYFEIKPFKYMGKTDRYGVYLWLRKELKTKWMFHQPLHRYIIRQCYTLPDILFSVDRNENNEMGLQDLEFEMQRHLISSRQCIQEFYRNIEEMVQKDITNLQSTMLESYLGSCTCALSIYLSRIIMNTLNRTVEITRSSEMPVLKLCVTYNLKMELFPTCQQLVELFQCFVKDTLALTDQLYILQRLRLDNCQDKKITLCITDEYICSILDEIESNILAIYMPVLEYLKSVDDDMKAIYYDMNNHTDVSDLRFEIGCDRMKYYNTFHTRISLIPEVEYFDMGIVFLSEYINILKKRLCSIKENIFGALSTQNHWEFKDIQETFEIIKTRASICPITTEQTIEIGKYMTWVKGEFISEATERIRESSIRLTSLLMIGIIEEEHMNLSIGIVKEFDEIEPLVDENLSMFEQLKFEAEEKLQKNIENVNEFIKEVHPTLCLLDDMNDIANVREYLGKINQHLLRIKNIEGHIQWINNEEIALSFPVSSYTEFEELKNYVYPFFHLMKLSIDVQRNVSVWLEGQLDLQSFESTKVKVEEYHAELTEIQKTYRKKLRQAQDENLQMRFKGTVDDPDITNWPAPLKICSQTIKIIEDFHPCLSLMKIVCNSALRNRHWKKMSTVASIDLLPNAGSTLKKLMSYDLKPFLAPLELVSQEASREEEILQFVNDLKDDWLRIKLEETTDEKLGDPFFTNLKKIIELCKDNLQLLSLQRRSAYIKPHQEKIEQFEHELLKLKEIFIMYLKFQEKFFHLLPFFRFAHNNEISFQKSKDFSRIHDFKKRLHASMKIDVFGTLKMERLVVEIQEYYEMFEIIYSGIRMYLRSLREEFPRFYFLSDEELIELLSYALFENDILQHYLSTCFKFIWKLELENGKISGLEGRFGEKINFPNGILIKHDVLNIFRSVEINLSKILLEQIQDVVKKNLTQDEILYSHLGQAVYVAIEIQCTLLAQRALSGNCDALNEIYGLIKYYTEHVKQSIVTRSEKITAERIAITLLQNKEFIEKIIGCKTDHKDFSWLSRIKHYFENEQYFISVLNFTSNYGYEYFGTLPFTVLSYYTERANVAILNAYISNYGSAIHGPACSGKTEIFKNLAVLLGVKFMIVPCNESISYGIVERFLIGSLKSTMWICFDEINKVKFPVLSMMSELLNDLKNSAVRVEKKTFKSFFCVTLDPTFPKLTDLPITFKSHLRSIGLLALDYVKFSENVLISNGFQNARELSRTIGWLINFLPEILLENSYDFSIRLLKKILSSCCQTVEVHNDEKLTILHALQKTIQSMLTKSDRKIFNNLLETHFGFIQSNALPSISRERIISSLTTHKLYPSESYIEKISATLDSINSRSDAVLLGDTCAGKTKALQVLHEISGLESGLEIINPAILNGSNLYGFMDSTHMLWKDGVLTMVLRKFSRRNKGNWLVIDGPIEPNWIEAFYSVLEGENTITLGSGELLSVRETTTILFEVSDLKYASPSLVSRCAVIYFEVDSKPWMLLLDQWIEENYNFLLETFRKLMKDLFIWLIPPLIKFVNENCTQECTQGNFCLVRSILTFTKILLNEALTKKDEDVKNFNIWLQASVFQSTYNGLAASLCSDSLIKFDTFYKKLCKNQIPEYSMPESIDRIDVNIPTEGLFLEYSYTYKGRGNFKYIPDSLKNEKIIFQEYVDDILVPTTDSIRNLTILEMHVSNGVPILLAGPSGSGKTLYIKHFLKQVLGKSKFAFQLLNFIPRLTPNKLKSVIQSNIMKTMSFNKTRTAKQNLVIIEDLNIVTLNEYNTSGVIELLRQVLDHEFWYDNSSHEKQPIKDLLFIATMCPKGGFCKKITPRLLKHFNIFKTDNVSEENICRIFTNILLVIWKHNGFTSDITTITSSLINGWHNIYNFCLDNFKSSPLKFGYSYNVWDFFRALSSFIILKKDAADSNKKLYSKLWIHESIRVFADRLSDVNEKKMLYNRIIEAYEQYFKESFDEAFNGLAKTEIDNIYFFSTPMKYEEIELRNVTEIMDEIRNSYSMKTGIKVVLFDDFLIQTIKISRIISMDNSNGLLIGFPGTGKRTIIKLITLLYNYQMSTPNISHNYNTKKWHETLKQMIYEVGGLGKSLVLYLTEEHLKYQFILEDINFFLKNGDIIDLFDIEEEPSILSMVRHNTQEKNINLDVNSDAVYSFFVKRCKANLHVMLNCDYTILHNRMNKFQSMVKFFTIIWFNGWSESVLTSIGNAWIEQLEVSNDIKSTLPGIFVRFFNDSKILTRNIYERLGQKYHITTESYVEFLKLFVDIMKKEQCALNIKRENYLNGLQKLEFADSQIKKLQENLAAYQLQLKIMAKKAAEMTKRIAKETLEVERASDLVRKDEKIANKQAEAAAALKLDCEADLAQAIPILEDAIEALNTLKPSDITLVKSMKNPPDAIKLVMAAVCVIKDVKPDKIPDPATGRKLIDYWGPSKRILGDMNFLQTLKDFDKDHIKAEIMVKIRKDYLPHKDFQPHVVAKASSAAEGLCKWIIAMDMYDNVAKEVAPKKGKLEKAEREYAQTVATLEEKKLEVVRLEKQLAQLNSKLEEANKKQEILQQTAKACSKKLDRSVILISGFEPEKNRWAGEVINLDHKHKCLCGDVTLICGAISYLSSIPSKYREDTLNSWYISVSGNVLCTKNWKLTTNLLSNENIETCGLPDENYFTENCIILKYSHKWPLFIDPQGIGNNWVRKTINPQLLYIVKYEDDDFIRKVESAITTGNYVLVDNFTETISLTFDALFKREIINENSLNFINFEGRRISFHENFKLFLTTSSAVPNYSREFSKKIKIVNFSLTDTALHRKLLRTVIKIENAVVNNHMKVFRRKETERETLIIYYEEKILKTLSNAKADVLEDQETLKILDNTKKLCKQARQPIDGGTFSTTFFEMQRKFDDFSHYASVLFFCIQEFSLTNKLSKMSYKSFIHVYKKSILSAALSRDISKRIQNVTDFLTFTISKLIRRILAGRDALNFLFNLSCRILIFRNQVNIEEIDFLYKRRRHERRKILKNMEKDLGNLDIPREDPIDYYEKLKSLENLEIFNGLEKSFRENKKAWCDYIELEQPENHAIPVPWHEKLNVFQIFLLIHTLRIDRTKYCIRKLISNVMGEKYVKPLNVDFEELYAESFCLAPILLLTTNRISPLAKLRNFACHKNFINKFRSVCLTEGANLTAEKLIEEGQKDGLWICLLNFHLSKSWTLRLQDICDGMNYDNTHENFRLWLVCDIMFELSEELQERCVKIVYDESDLFREDLLRSYKEIVSDVSDQSDQNYSQKIIRLIYRVICFHSVLTWRQKFELVAWNKPYEFGDYDLKYVIKLIHLYNFEEVSKYLIGEYSYFGQLLDDTDYRMSNVLFDEFTNLDSKIFPFPTKNDSHDFIAHIEKLPSESVKLLRINEIILYRQNVNDSYSFDTYIDLINSFCPYDSEKTDVLEVIKYILQLLDVEIVVKNNKHHFKAVLSLEVRSYSRLIEQIKKYLKKIQFLQDRNLPLSPVLQDIVSDLTINKIPGIFCKYSYRTNENFSTYIRSLTKRLKFFKNWSEIENPTNYWISAFFYPKFMLAFQKLNYAQILKEDIRNYSNIYEFDNSNRKTFNIYGLFLINAKFNEDDQSVELLPKNLYFYKMPCLSLKPSTNKDNTSLWPLYQSDDRIDLTKNGEKCRKTLLFIRIRSKSSSSILIQQGVAMTCECPRKFDRN